jgi:radical SAM superfamily enzyme YgiQ (UPF0313 family)
MENNLWELPHWMHWLGGTLVANGFDSLGTLDFYTSECALTGIDRTKVKATVKEHPADAYLFSPMTPNLPFAFEIAEVIKDIYPESKVIFGGVVATPLHREVAAHDHVDVVVYDRGEFALPHLMRTLRDGGDLSRVGNLSYRDDQGEVVTTAKKYPYPGVEDVPFPKIDLFPREVGKDLRYLRQVYGLGCPYKCSFCTIQTIGRKTEYFSIDRVLAEIRGYREYYGKHHNIYWGDETFTVNAKRTIALCDALEAEGGIHYDIQTRLNCLANDQVLQALQRSGCRWIEIGLETINQESQNLYKHRMKLDNLEQTLERIRDLGMGVCSFMVNGFPNQTLDDMRRSIDWICELIERRLLQASYLFGLVPYPGSAMYHQPEKYGLELLHHDFQYYHEDLMPVYRTSYAEPEQIYEVFLESVAQLAQAMSVKPSFGDVPPTEELASFGTFWQGSHV